MEITELTIEKIDARLSEIPTRLEELAQMIKVKTDELGKSKIRGLLTPPIHKSIRALEDEQRELLAEQEALTQERQNIQAATAREIAEAAAAEHEKLSEKIMQLRFEIIKGLCASQGKLLELEKSEALNEQNATAAGALVGPMPADTIVIQAGQIARFIDRALDDIISLNGQENLAKAGIDIPNIYEEREKLFGRYPSVNSGVAETARVQPDEKSGPVGFDEAMRRAAGLPVK